MNKPLLIGITGGIGSGKSTVCKIFESLGISVYYADDRGKALLTEDAALTLSVKQEFGEESYTPSGELNRQYLAQTVFFDPERLEALNRLVHPAVAEDFEKWAKHNSDSQYLLKEAALLYETGSYKSLDATICVMASKDLRMQRVLLRDHQRTSDQVREIMGKQVDDNVRREFSDYTIKNDSKTLLIPQVLEKHKQILKSNRN